MCRSRATVNRRLAAIRTFYYFLETDSGDALANRVLPRRHVIRQGRRLPCDVLTRSAAEAERPWISVARRGWHKRG